jgi:hypothetical protein
MLNSGPNGLLSIPDRTNGRADCAAHFLIKDSTRIVLIWAANNGQMSYFAFQIGPSVSYLMAHGMGFSGSKIWFGGLPYLERRFATVRRPPRRVWRRSATRAWWRRTAWSSATPRGCPTRTLTHKSSQCCCFYRCVGGPGKVGFRF